MQDLTMQEEIALTVIWRLKEDACGVRIKKNVAEITKKQSNERTAIRQMGSVSPVKILRPGPKFTVNESMRA